MKSGQEFSITYLRLRRYDIFSRKIKHARIILTWSDIASDSCFADEGRKFPEYKGRSEKRWARVLICLVWRKALKSEK
jgi:hypothetical protein